MAGDTTRPFAGKLLRDQNMVDHLCELLNNIVATGLRYFRLDVANTRCFALLHPSQRGSQF